ncbi:MAG: hypothetical protein GKC53_01890 [Neisseriaceae bacterium]|nr:MAG: hypothetical protein GKC53_01890 [Neisseriaceae bacterium]
MQLAKITRIISTIIGMSVISAHVTLAGINIYEYVEKPKKSEFDNVVIFGDSLSDANYIDKSRYVAGGPGYPGYFDVISQYFSNKPSQFVKYNGTNYAISASIAPRVYEQVERYLADNNGHANKNNLHVLWSGGSDVNVSIILNLFTIPFYDFNQLEYNLYDHSQSSPTQIISDSARLLLDHGAPYVIMPNVPNAGYAPITSLTHVDIVVTLLYGLLPPPLNRTLGLQIRKDYGDFLDKRLRSLPQGQGHDFLVNRNIDLLQIQFPLIPRPILEALLHIVINMQTSITRQFNYSTIKALMPLNGQIVYIDAAGMFDELIDNAVGWHVESMNLTPCLVSFPSAHCNEEDGIFYNDRRYMFGDWFHPSWETHVLIGQYIISVLTAPDQVASIVKQLANLNYSNQSYLQAYLTGLRSDLSQQESGWSVFGGYSGLYDIPNSYVGSSKNTYTNILTIGLNYQYSPYLSMGALFALSHGKHKPYKDFTYKQSSQNIIFYSQWLDHLGRYWLNTDINFGYLNARNIQRSLRLGEIVRIEPANSTNSKIYGLNIRGGWNLWINNEDETLQMGPLLGLSYNHYKFKGFQDKYNHMTSMRFGDARYNQAYATLGWYVNTRKFEISDKPTNLSAEITYGQNFKNKDFKISSGIKASPLYFNKKVELANYSRWVEINSNLNVTLNKATTLNTGLGFKFNNKKNKNIQLSINIQHKF